MYLNRTQLKTNKILIIRIQNIFLALNNSKLNMITNQSENKIKKIITLYSELITVHPSFLP